MEEFERKRKEEQKREQRRRKNEVKWKIGYNLNENGDISKSSGLKQLNDLQSLIS